MRREKFDGRSRPSTDLYRKRFDEIFKKEKLLQSYLEKVMKKRRGC